jgi:hypothetical protein
MATTWTTALFRPTNRLRDLVRERRGDDSYELPKGRTEVELFPDISPEDVLATDIAYVDFCRFLGSDKLVWLGPDVYICTIYVPRPGIYQLVVQLGSSSRRAPCLCIYAATESETSATATTATCDFAVRLLATNKYDGAFIQGYLNDSLPISGPGLSRFFQESKANPVTFRNVIFNEEQIRALAATESHPCMTVSLVGCKLLRDPSCHYAFVECLRRDRGPTQLHQCKIDCHVLAAALDGNSRVTWLRLDDSATGDAGNSVFFRSLAENKGLVKLDFKDCSISDENWAILCQSLRGHPTLTSLGLHNTKPGARTLSKEQKAQRTRLVAEMMQAHTLLQTIHFYVLERDEQIFVESIYPRLQTNIETKLYRPRVRRIKKADIALRRPLLGRALQTKSVRNKSNLLWMFLSGNQDIVLRSNEEGEQVEVAASVPVEVLTRVPVELAASAPVEIAASAPVEATATRKRKF